MLSRAHVAGDIPRARQAPRRRTGRRERLASPLLLLRSTQYDTAARTFACNPAPPQRLVKHARVLTQVGFTGRGWLGVAFSTERHLARDKTPTTMTRQWEHQRRRSRSRSRSPPSVPRRVVTRSRLPHDEPRGSERRFKTCLSCLLKPSGFLIRSSLSIS